jgi:hypothetical protein
MMYQCLSASFLSAVIKMSEQVVPSVVAQRIIIKILTNGNVKPADILTRLRAQFADEKLSRILMYEVCGLTLLLRVGTLWR